MRIVLIIFILFTIKSYAQLTPYALDSNLLSDISKELEDFDNYILSDISSFWSDDLQIDGYGKLNTGKLKRIRLKLKKDTTLGFYGAQIKKVKYRKGKLDKYSIKLEDCEKLNKKEIEDRTIIDTDGDGIIRDAMSDGPVYTLLIKTRDKTIKMIQIYSPKFYQKTNYSADREKYIELVSIIKEK